MWEGSARSGRGQVVARKKKEKKREKVGELERAQSEKRKISQRCYKATIRIKGETKGLKGEGLKGDRKG